ncbi:beta-N-acetylhexosaminidase [Thalassotalea hakodatensis]|uniref:beta-N-acetylhexosaminidase n=1 Tax=Thalassotalea hakodatensis TaxID=3030492 RepID=UPI00389ACF66
MGPIMMDVHGTSLTEQDKELVQHPLVGGLILFSRNFESVQQIRELISHIRHTANKPLLIGVDHEGGRVQRFREGFSQIPAMGRFIEHANNNIAQAQQYAANAGALMAMEVQGVGIDISFSPVLDINGVSDVIGQRAFSQNIEQIAPLAKAFIQGMKSAGMKCTAKHFPGHGSVKADSHIAMPIDTRSFADISHHDLQPFRQLINENMIDAVMPAHVIFPDVDDKSVGFSTKWLKQVLRKSLGFSGAIFSDDLSMHGASSIGGYIERAEAAQEAGCDMLLLCNNREACIDVIDNANISIHQESKLRLSAMLATKPMNWQQMQASQVWQQLTQLNNLFLENT